MAASNPFDCEVRDLKKTYGHDRGEIQVLRGINCLFKRGERVALVGASGSGKSTFLHILGTLDRPTSGEVFYNGQAAPFANDPQLSAFRNQNIGFVFQFHHLIAELTALENVILPMRIAGEGLAQSQARGKELLERVGVANRADHRPTEMSGGEQQRVAVARAVCRRPALILADEPTGNLDSQNGAKVLDLLLELNESENITLVVATHNPDISASFNRRYEMKDGVLHAA